MAGGGATGPTIGSWPGREAGHNRFLRILLGALEAAGARIVDFPDSRAIDLADVDVLLLHWPERIFGEAAHSREAAARMLGLLYRLRTRPAGVRIVWIVHNLNPHEGRWFKRLSWPAYARGLVGTVDAALTLSEGTCPVVRAAFPGLGRKPLGHFWHPLYPGERITPAARAAARAAFGWPETARVYGYCGQIRPYKGVEDLVAAFTGLAADPDARLLVAGRPSDGATTVALQRLAGEDPRIRLVLQDLSAADFRANLGACDIVVAPLRRYLHSGSIVHALSAHRPVLTPATPFADSLARVLASPGWLQTYEGPLTTATLASARRPPEGPLDLAPLAPEAAAERILRFLAEIAPAPGRERAGSTP